MNGKVKNALFRRPCDDPIGNFHCGVNRENGSIKKRPMAQPKLTSFVVMKGVIGALVMLDFEALPEWALGGQLKHIPYRQTAI